MKKILDKSTLNNEVCVVVGTRPGIIKFCPVIRALEKMKVRFFIIHTGQHYSYNMDKKFFDDLKLPTPRYTNNTVSKEVLHGAQTAEMIKEVEKGLLESKPQVTIVGGDANTNLAGALAARKLGITLIHMEAGLRSNDWSMPEEHNRIMIDHISDILLAPTEIAKDNLLKENVKGDISIVGNTIVDSIYQNISIAEKNIKILHDLNLKENQFFLLTIHREENVDNDKKLRLIFENILLVLKEFSLKIIFPIHPRTKKRLIQLDLWDRMRNIEGFIIIDAIGYLDFLMLLKCAFLVLTDSGGIQEESCILKVPCITLRENTERPETIEVGSNIVVGDDTELLFDSIKKLGKAERSWHNPYGDGKAGDRIADIIKSILH